MTKSEREDLAEGLRKTIDRIRTLLQEVSPGTPLPNHADYAQAFGMALTLHILGHWLHPGRGESEFQALVNEILPPVRLGAD